MKNYLAALSLALLCGCAPKTIVGDWQIAEPKGDLKSLTLRVNPNGTYAGQDEFAGPRDQVYKHTTAGTWTGDPEKTVVTKSTDSGREPDEPVETGSLERNDKDQLIWKTAKDEPAIIFVRDKRH